MQKVEARNLVIIIHVANVYKKEGYKVFRDFIYLDMERIQSIISQLQEGLLTEIMSGKAKEVTGSAKLGFLQQIISADLSGKN